MRDRRDFIRTSFLFSGALGLACTLPGCKRFLLESPPNSITSNIFFKTEKDLELYANGFLQHNIPTPETLTFGDQFSDNIVTTKSNVFLSGTWTADQQGGWSIGTWGNLKDCNYFLENIDKVDASEEIKNHYKGVGRFWRAWFYYSMVKTFGNVPWYDTPVNPDDKAALNKPRDSRETVMEHVLEDLSFAGTNCSSASKFVASSSRINKWTALAFKSRVCLFEGTYRKYHSELGLSGSADKFLREAAKAAKELIDDGPFRLVDNGQPMTQYRSLFINEDVNTQEIILANVFSDSKSRWHNITRQYNTASFGNRWSLAKDFVNTYLMRDGSRFTDKPDFNKLVFADEMKNRDYRLQQTIRTPGFTRTVKGVPNTPVAPDFRVTLTGYQPIKWSLDDDAFDTNDKCTNSLSVFRYAEVLLNYAEAKAELNEFDESIWNLTIKPLRERAGVSATIPATTDPYLEQYFLNQTSDKWVLEVRRERGVELVLENLRYDDDMRWKMGRLLERPWLGMYVPEINKAIDLNADGVADVAFADGGNSVPGVFNVQLNNGFSLQNGDEGLLIYEFKRTWQDKKYLHPIPQDAINLNPNLKPQNEGWDK